MKPPDRVHYWTTSCALGVDAVERGSDVHLFGVVHHLVRQEPPGLYGAAGVGHALLRGLQGGPNLGGGDHLRNRLKPPSSPPKNLYPTKPEGLNRDFLRYVTDDHAGGRASGGETAEVELGTATANIDGSG